MSEIQNPAHTGGIFGGFLSGHDGDEIGTGQVPVESSDFLFGKVNDADGSGEQCVVAAFGHVLARAEFAAPLPNDDGARLGRLTLVEFDAQALGDGIPS
jgi:hypothetical protein